MGTNWHTWVMISWHWVHFIRGAQLHRCCIRLVLVRNLTSTNARMLMVTLWYWNWVDWVGHHSGQWRTIGITWNIGHISIGCTWVDWLQSRNMHSWRYCIRMDSQLQSLWIGVDMPLWCHWLMDSLCAMLRRLLMLRVCSNSALIYWRSLHNMDSFIQTSMNSISWSRNNISWLSSISHKWYQHHISMLTTISRETWIASILISSGSSNVMPQQIWIWHPLKLLRDWTWKSRHLGLLRQNYIIRMISMYWKNYSK